MSFNGDLQQEKQTLPRHCRTAEKKLIKRCRMYSIVI